MGDTAGDSLGEALLELPRLLSDLLRDLLPDLLADLLPVDGGPRPTSCLLEDSGGEAAGEAPSAAGGADITGAGTPPAGDLLVSDVLAGDDEAPKAAALPVFLGLAATSTTWSHFSSSSESSTLTSTPMLISAIEHMLASKPPPASDASREAE